MKMRGYQYPAPHDVPHHLWGSVCLEGMHVAVGRGDLVVRVQDCGPDGDHPRCDAVELFCHGWKVVIEGRVWELLRDHGYHAQQALTGGKVFNRGVLDVLQQLGHEALVMNGIRPDGATHVVGPPTLRAVLGDGGTDSGKVPPLVSLLDPRSDRLQPEGLTPATIVVIALLAILHTW